MVAKHQVFRGPLARQLGDPGIRVHGHQFVERAGHWSLQHGLLRLVGALELSCCPLSHSFCCFFFFLFFFWGVVYSKIVQCFLFTSNNCLFIFFRSIDELFGFVGFAFGFLLSKAGILVCSKVYGF